MHPTRLSSTLYCYIFSSANDEMNAHANVQPFLIATLLFVVPLMGFGRRLLDRLIPKNDLDAQRRPRALSMLVYGILRSVMLVLDLYNAPEFFKNWFNPLNVSPSFYSLNLLVSGIYTSMIGKIKYISREC